MKYFTPERYLALQDFSSNEAMNAADADWEKEVDAYEAQLALIRPRLPESVRQLLEGYFLHDADVISVGRQNGRFDVVLQLDVPPNDLLTISYVLTGEPTLNTAAFPAPGSTGPLWLYEELDATPQGYLHSVLFSNGWTLDVPFNDVTLTASTAVFPVRAQTAAKSA
jgi:hypothetical protein